jgi:hypothetical protein
MFETTVDLHSGLDAEALLAAKRAQIDLGTARAADILVGYLRRFSSNELLHARTGTLARLWDSQKVADGEYMISNRAPQAAILEYGGEIRPKTAKALAIPLDAATTDRGVARYPTAREAFDAEHLFMLKAADGRAYLAKRLGPNQLEVWYALKDQVTIPAFQYASEAIAAGRDQAIEEVRSALQN